MTVDWRDLCTFHLKNVSIETFKLGKYFLNMYEFFVLPLLWKIIIHWLWSIFVFFLYHIHVKDLFELWITVYPSTSPTPPPPQPLPFFFLSVYAYANLFSKEMVMFLWIKRGSIVTKLSFMLSFCLFRWPALELRNNILFPL